MQDLSDKKNKVKLIFETSYIPSVNSMYEGKWRNGKLIKYRSNEVIKITQELESQLDNVYEKGLLDWFVKGECNYSFTIQALMKSQFGRRDLDNTNKVVQDVIFSYFETDDSKIVENHMYKSSFKNSENEVLLVEIAESDFNPYFFESKNLDGVRSHLSSKYSEELTLMFDLSYIPSFNSMYVHKWTSDGRFIKHRSSTVIKLTGDMESQLDEIWSEDLAPWFWKRNDKYYSLTVQPLFKQGFETRDLDNINKVIQDVIFDYFEVNDSRVIENHMYKSSFKHSDREFLIIKISESRFDPFYFDK